MVGLGVVCYVGDEVLKVKHFLTYRRCWCCCEVDGFDHENGNPELQRCNAATLGEVWVYVRENFPRRKLKIQPTSEVAGCEAIACSFDESANLRLRKTGILAFM